MPPRWPAVHHQSPDEQRLCSGVIDRFLDKQILLQQNDARHSVSEHKEIDDFLGELNDMDMSSPGWLVKFKEMRHRYEHHIDEEEEEMFPAAAEELSAAEEERLGNLFEKRKPKELERAEENPPSAEDERE